MRSPSFSAAAVVQQLRFAMLCTLVWAGIAGCSKPSQSSEAQAGQGSFIGVWTSNGLSRILVLNPDKTYFLCVRAERQFAFGIAYTVTQGTYAVRPKQLELSIAGGVLVVTIAPGAIAEKLVITETAAAAITHHELQRRKASDIASLNSFPGAPKSAGEAGTVFFAAEGVEPLTIQYTLRNPGAHPVYELKTIGRDDLYLQVIEGGATTHLGLIVSTERGKAYLAELSRQDEAEKTVLSASLPSPSVGEAPNVGQGLRFALTQAAAGVTVGEIISP